MLEDRRGARGLLWLLLVGALGACGRPESRPAVLGRGDSAPVVATFEGEWDPATGKLTIRSAPAGAPNALYEYPIHQDGTPGSGPVDTIELVTETSPPPGVTANGCVSSDSFDGTITLRSFYRDQTFSNVYVELTSLTPSGHTVCNSDTPVTGVSAQYGLWSYGTLGPAGSGTRLWRFRYATAERFTFTGRIMAKLGLPVPVTGSPEFDWSPSDIVWPPSSFEEVSSTTAHVVWNGTTFVDTKGHITFAPNTTAPAQVAVGLWDPPETYVGPFTSTNFFIASPANGASYMDTSGEFTACVKFKPGAHAVQVDGVWGPNKILLAKGQPEPSDGTHQGWALMQMHGEYCFHYRTPADAAAGDVMVYVDAQTTVPQTYTYDYICGGRVSAAHAGTSTDVLHVAAHGMLTGFDEPETGTFSGNGASFPLVIGAYPDGSDALSDGGVYEFILDSRPATVAVMNEIVGDAESRELFPGSTSYSASYVPASAGSAGTTVTGADGGSYVVPLYGTVPLPSDGSGLLQEGSVVAYTHPLMQDTSASGFCVGVEVVADADWSAVSGGLVALAGSDFTLTFFPQTGGNPQIALPVNYAWTAVTIPSWPATVSPALPGHTLKACVEPYVASPANQARIYADGAQISQVNVTGPITNFANASATLQIGTGGYPLTPLSGARIRRVFACPSPVAANCY